MFHITIVQTSGYFIWNGGRTVCELVISGKRCLCGEVDIQGSKNAVLPILAATLLTNETCVIHNCPRIADVEAAAEILRGLGASVNLDGNTVCVCAADISSNVIPKKLMEKMRSSVMFLGAVLGRTGEAIVCRPGGCRLGSRPIDIHISSLGRLGAKIEEAGDCIVCHLPEARSDDITLLYPSVGATENIMLMCAGSGCSVRIYNAAREPEIVDLQNFLNLMGARICGAGTDCIIIRPSGGLGGAEYSVMPDRIVAATYAMAVAACGGEALLRRAESEHMRLVLEVLKKIGCEIIEEDEGIRTAAFGRPKPVHMIKTMPYPGFPTDVQPMLAAALATADGESVICESIFDSRFGYAKELEKMGAKISGGGSSIRIEGVPNLLGANTEAKDLRGGAALVIAAAAAAGITVISGVEYINRGYENIERDLSRLGADILRI